MGRDKLRIRALGSLVSSHKNRSSRVLRNGRGTPLLFLEEVIREGEDGETEQVQNEEIPPQPTPEMIYQVLAYLSGLSDQGQAPPVFSAPTPPLSEVQHAASMAPRMDVPLDIGTFPRLTTGL